jgi:hypothetical protein
MKKSLEIEGTLYVLQERSLMEQSLYGRNVRSFRSYPKMVRALRRERQTLLASIRPVDIRSGRSPDKPYAYTHYVLPLLFLQEIA